MVSAGYVLYKNAIDYNLKVRLNCPVLKKLPKLFRLTLKLLEALAPLVFALVVLKPITSAN